MVLAYTFAPVSPFYEGIVLACTFTPVSPFHKGLFLACTFALVSPFFIRYLFGLLFGISRSCGYEPRKVLGSLGRLIDCSALL